MSDTKNVQEKQIMLDTDNVVKVKIFMSHPEKQDYLPEYKTIGAAGMDIIYTGDTMVTIGRNEVFKARTNLHVSIPDGYQLSIRPRSGLAINSGITIANTPGTIDSDYRGEIIIGLVNVSTNPYILEHGQRVAQFILEKVYRVEWEPVGSLEELGDSQRGAGGFGSTGS